MFARALHTAAESHALLVTCIREVVVVRDQRSKIVCSSKECSEQWREGIKETKGLVVASSSHGARGQQMTCLPARHAAHYLELSARDEENGGA